MLKIAIGTTRKPKIEGIQHGVQTCPYFDGKEVEYISHKVASDISDMPLTLEETMQWAQNRARNLIKQNIEADLYVGLEWGVMKIGDCAYLWGVVYVENNEWEWHFGFSPLLEVPREISRRLFDCLEELGPVMGELSGKLDTRSQEGSMGARSDDMFTRKDQFATAFKSAIAPFHNDYYKIESDK